jgi:hypothetical protein
MNWIRFGRVWSLPNRGINSAYSWMDWGKPLITSVGILGVQAKIRTEDSPNMSLKRYCFAKPLGPPASAQVKSTQIYTVTLPLTSRDNILHSSGPGT